MTPTDPSFARLRIFPVTWPIPGPRDRPRPGGRGPFGADLIHLFFVAFGMLGLGVMTVMTTKRRRES